MPDWSRRDFVQASALAAASAALIRHASPVFAGPSDEYSQWDATTLAAMVRKGDVSAMELLDAAIARAQRWNPVLNAIVIEHHQLARQTAKAKPSGPLAGVPFLLKDLGTYLEDTVTTEGSRFFRDAVADHTSFLVQRYRDAGVVIFGKTASPEFGKSPVTESLLWGATRNPWNPEHVPCGSSGGSAAAVAAGVLPVAHASDGGGSIRLPASACGLFGLKPSRFRTPIGPGKGDGGGLTSHHVISRSVRDSALFLDVGRGPEPGGYGSIREPTQPYVDTIKRKPGRLRIGLMTQPAVPLPVDAECIAATHNAAKLCESLGHRVEEVTLPIDGIAAFTAAGTIMSLSSHLMIRAREKALGREVSPNDIEPINWLRMQQYQNISADQLNAARALQVETHYQLARFMETYDVILSPTIAVVPGKIGEMSPERSIEEFDRAATNYSLFTMLYNFTGQPAMSVPLHWSENGLPVGVQFAGRYGEEGLLLQLAAQLEEAQPWFNRQPEFPA